MKRKLRLNRDTIQCLTPAEASQAQGAAAGTRDASCLIGSCACTVNCSQRTCVVSCAGTCFQISCVAATCY